MNFIQAIDNLDYYNKSIVTNIEARIAADNNASLINSAYRLETIKRRCTEEIYNNLDSKAITINNYIFELRTQKRGYISAHNFISCRDMNGIGCEIHIVLGNTKTLDLTIFRYPKVNSFPKERESHIIHDNYSQYLKDLTKTKQLALANLRSKYENKNKILITDQYHIKYLLAEITLLNNIINLIESNV